MIFSVEICRAALRLIFFKLLMTDIQKFPVFLRRHASIFFLAGRTITGESKDIRAALHHRIDEIRNFFSIRSGYRSHNYRTNPRTLDTVYFFEGAAERTGFSEPVVGLPQPVQRELVLPTAIFL